MKLRDLLTLIQKLADEINTSAYIVGGTPRDKILNITNQISDLDITTGSDKIHFLMKSLSMDLSKKYLIKTHQADDGHTSIIFPGNKFKLDGSSHFVVPHIDEILYHIGIKNPTDMEREMFSRDFTCNSLMMSLDLKKIKDPTKLGLNDIKKKLLKTCLDPDTTFRYNTNRIIRTIYLSSKLDFDIDPETIRWISENKEMIRLPSDSYLIKNLDKAIDKNSDRAIYFINKMNLWDVLPITNKLRPYMGKKIVANKNIFLKDARKQDDLAILKSNIGNYIHFSNSERFGISYHKDIHPGNPRGVYGFPLTSEQFGYIVNNNPDHFYDYGYHKYIYIFNVNGNILDLDNFNFVTTINQIKKFISTQYGDKLGENDVDYINTFLIPSTYSGKDGHKLMRFLRDVIRTLYHRKVIINEHSASNIILRGIGYDAVQTKAEGFGDDLTSQIVGLTPTAINLIAKVNNPMLSKQDIIEINELQKRKNAQLRHNFDYGENLYMNLDKYKSVSDFRRKRRKKRMKEIKKIKDMKLK